MAKGKEPAQGIVRNPRQPLGKVSVIPQRDVEAIIRGAARDVSRKDAADNARVPRRPERNEQNWRRG